MTLARDFFRAALRAPARRRVFEARLLHLRDRVCQSPRNVAGLHIIADSQFVIGNRVRIAAAFCLYKMNSIATVAIRILWRHIMIRYALFARFEAKPGKESDVAAFLETGLSLANQETTTPIWFALRLSKTVFGVFDAFENEAGRQAHLEGPIAKALMSKADELFVRPPSIEKIDVLGLKNRPA
jgi:quinol monooxygenase YgiN